MSRLSFLQREKRNLGSRLFFMHLLTFLCLPFFAQRHAQRVYRIRID